jgi:hypothetical protein
MAPATVEVEQDRAKQVTLLNTDDAPHSTRHTFDCKLGVDGGVQS